MKPVEWVFLRVSQKSGLPKYRTGPVDVSDLVALAEADAAYDQLVRKAICDVLEKAGAEATLRRKDRCRTQVSPHELRYAVACSLRYGIFDCTDGHLRSLREWSRARVFLPDAVARRAIRLAVARLAPIPAPGEGQKTGRPTHPAKEWYAKQAFLRGSRTIKTLQKEMAAALGEDPPSETTIRSWEREASKKSSTETPNENPN